VARPSFLSVVLRDAERPHALVNSRNGRVVASQVELALDSKSRRRGLLGREGLDAGAALVIAPCSAVHTFSMRFAIDVVFVARDGRVVKTYAGVERGRIAFGLGAFAAIELAAGAVAPSETARGDVLQLERR